MCLYSAQAVAAKNYYTALKLQDPNITIIADDSGKREVRRKRFEEHLQQLEPNKDIRDELLRHIAFIDQRINYVQPEEIDALLKDRAGTLKPYINKMFHGAQIPDAVHQKIMHDYGEVLRRRDKFILFLPSLVATMSTYAQAFWQTHKGTDPNLSKILTGIQSRGAEVQLQALVAEYDPIIKPTDIGLVAQAFQHCTVPLSKVTVYEKFSHSSYGVNPEDTKDVLTQLSPN